MSKFKRGVRIPRTVLSAKKFLNRESYAGAWENTAVPAALKMKFGDLELSLIGHPLLIAGLTVALIGLTYWL